LGAGFVFVAAFLVFAPSFGAYFAVLDFNHLDAIRSTDAGTFFRRIFDPSDGGRTVVFTGDLYRPIYYTYFWFEYRLFGADPQPYYVTNALLHASNAVLVWVLARRLTRSDVAATAGALIWAFHPQYADTVAWISSTTDLLLVLLSLMALLLYMSALESTGMRRWAAFGGSFAATLLAIGAKESGTALVPIMAGYHLLFHRPESLRPRDWPWPLLPFALILLVYFPLRAALVGNLAEEGDRELFSPQAMRNIHVLSGLAGAPLVGEELSNSDFGVAQGFAGMLVIGGTLVACALGSRREWFLSGWYYVAMAPYLVLPPLWIVGRYLYLPLIGPAILGGIGLALALERLPLERFGAYARQVALAAVLLGIAVWFGVLNAGYQDWLTEKGETSQAFLDDVREIYPSLPDDGRIIITEYPSLLSFFPDDGWTLRPAVRLIFDSDIEVITMSQIESGEVPPPTEQDLWYPPRAAADAR
jgi:hypothetical protein